MMFDTPGEIAVDVRGLSKVFLDPQRGEVEAVSDLEFSCRRGEILGLLGPNGAGKTTTLRMLATLLRPSRGTATVAGHDVIREPLEVRRSLGYLSSTTALYPRLTPRETLVYFGRLQGLEGESLRRRVSELIEVFELAEYADVLCGRLSTGTRQKVSIARAVVHDPPVLVLDEPTVGLDVLVLEVFHEWLRAARDGGCAVLLSTHTLSEVERLCDRAAVIHRGRLLEYGTLEEIRARAGASYLEDAVLGLLRPAQAAS